MKQGSILLAACCLFLGASLASSCNIPQMLLDLKAKKISLADYTKMYKDCLASYENKAGGSSDAAMVTPESVSTEFGFQPSCNSAKKVTQAIAKFENQGMFKAADGKEYPFNVQAVITFTEVNSQVTRIHAVISGVRDFLFDSDQLALHVHMIGETNPSCSAPGPHFNPCNKDHNDDPRVENRHVGDIAKVTVPPQTDVVRIDAMDTQVKLSGPLSILGRSVVVHAGSGSTRVACGTIALTEWEGRDHPAVIEALGQ